jgi:glucose/arabinose dehydrogenase
MTRPRPFRQLGPFFLLFIALVAAPASFPACKGGTIETKALDQASAYNVTRETVPEISVPQGFRAVLYAEGLNFPSSIVWDDKGSLYVLESRTVPVPTLKPKILRVTGKDLEPVAWEGAGAPTGDAAIGLTFHAGWLYVSHQEKDGTWGISRIKPEGGAAEAVLRGLPGTGDHNVNYIVFDREGALYYGIGSATNSGVVSSNDPVNKKWLEKAPTVRDLPCRDLVLHDVRFQDDNALTDAKEDKAFTGAYQPYGQSGARRVPAASPCMTAIYRLPVGAQTPELVAWGFRNPVALAFDAKGALLVGMHGADIRSTRPVRDDPDAVYRVVPGAWYGWPDYSAALVPVTDARYQPPPQFFAPGHTSIVPVIDREASGLKVPESSWILGVTKPHAALGGMTVVPGDGPFARWAGQDILSEMGDFQPQTDPVTADDPAGFQVEVLDPATKRLTVFARNRGDGPAKPASRLDSKTGFERPVDVKFGPDGLLYVLDFGVFNPTEGLQKVTPKTGRIFRIEPATR